MRRLPYSVLLKGVYIAAYSTPPGAKFSSKNHYKTMIFGVLEAEILRTPIKIEKLRRWSVTLSEFRKNFKFHIFFLKKTVPPRIDILLECYPAHRMA